MSDVNEQCWYVICTLGADEDGELPQAAVVRLVDLGIIEWRDGKPQPYFVADRNRAKKLATARSAAQDYASGPDIL